MLSCNPIGHAADLPSSEESALLPFSSSSWTNKFRLTKKVLKHKNTIFPRNGGGLFKEDTSGNHDFIFQRFLSMRNSFKSLKLSSSAFCEASPGSGGRPDCILKDSSSKNNNLNSTLEGSSSKDSGLGEEEEGSTPVNHGILATSRSPSEASHHKKHVMIREPSLSHLPSARRKIFNSCRVVKTKVYKGPNDLPDSSTSLSNVSSQWDNLYSKAYADLLSALPELEPASLKTLFHKEEVGGMEIEDISSLLRTIYSILYHDWKSTHPGDKTFLSLSLHSIQMFLVSVVSLLDLKDEEEEDLKERYERKFGELLKSCELIGYANVEICLRKSQRVFIQFWCSLLNVPLLKDSFSPTERRNILRLSLRMAEATSGHQEDLKVLKHRSSIF